LALRWIDATETQTQRPKTGQKKYYSGKKKHHTAKTMAATDVISSFSNRVPAKLLVGAVHIFAKTKAFKVAINFGC
jgi:hypothetical protein